jgi:hypothetical protein
MESILATDPTLKDKGRDRPSQPGPRPRGKIGRIVAGSLATGLLAAVLLAFAPFIPAEEPAVTGAVLCGFAIGWAMLAVLSVRSPISRSDGPRLLHCSWDWAACSW